MTPDQFRERMVKIHAMKDESDRLDRAADALEQATYREAGIEWHNRELRIELLALH